MKVFKFTAMFALLVMAVLVGCADDNSDVIPKGTTRTFVRNLNPDFAPSFLTALQNKGTYTPDVCMQWVNYKDKDGKDMGDKLELSNAACIDSLIDADEVLQSLSIEQHKQFFTNYYVIDDNSRQTLGHLVRLTSVPFNGETTVRYQMDELCDIGGYATACTIQIENSLFNTSEPLAITD